MGKVQDTINVMRRSVDLKHSIDRNKLFFIRRRAKWSFEDHPNCTVQEATQIITTQIGVVEAFLQPRIGIPSGSGLLITGEDGKTLKHFSIADITLRRNSMPTWLGEKKVRSFVGLILIRKYIVAKIVWRAAAIHKELWKSAPIRLEEPALDELIDRRLRVFDQMTYTVNSGRALANRSWNIGGALGPWHDGESYRAFEYPMLPQWKFDHLESQMRAEHWERWANESAGNYIVFNYKYSESIDIHFRPALAVQNDIVPLRETISGFLAPRLKPTDFTPAETFERIVAPTNDFRKRNWFYCDHVAATLHIEALRLALHRREGNDHTFNTELTKTPDYVVLFPFLTRAGSLDKDLLMADDQDPFFENLEVDLDDLQVGDLLIMWNHQFYDVFLGPGGAWRNEYSLVMDADTDERWGITAHHKLKLAGHGIDTETYGGMAQDLARHIQSILDAAHKAVADKLDHDAHATELIHLSHRIIRWAPYHETFDPPGPWWIVLPKSTWGDEWGFPTASAAAAGVPKTVEADASPGAGYNPPPISTAEILFPLYEPRFGASQPDAFPWNTYLEHRRTSSRPAPRRLEKIVADKHLVPGLYYQGSGHKIPVIRPKVRI